MSSFNLNDELIYKPKYIKYKNKYLQLKEQEGGLFEWPWSKSKKTDTPKNTGPAYLLYNKESFTALDKLIKKYYILSFMNTGIIDVNKSEKALKQCMIVDKDKDKVKDKDKILNTPSNLEKCSIVSYLNTTFKIPLNDVNGLFNVFLYKEYTKIINPILIFNFNAQKQLMECIQKYNNQLGKNKNNINISDIENVLNSNVNLYNTGKITIEDDDFVGTINPLENTTTYVKARPELIHLINNVGCQYRCKFFQDNIIMSTYKPLFELGIINKKVLPYSMSSYIKLYDVNDTYDANGTLQSIEKLLVDSVIQVEDFNFNANEGYTFKIKEIYYSINNAKDTKITEKLDIIVKNKNLNIDTIDRIVGLSLIYLTKLTDDTTFITMDIETMNKHIDIFERIAQNKNLINDKIIKIFEYDINYLFQVVHNDEFINMTSDSIIELIKNQINSSLTNKQKQLLNSSTLTNPLQPFTRATSMPNLKLN